MSFSKATRLRLIGIFVSKRAPELFNIHTESVITELSDIWSFGATVYHYRYGIPISDGTGFSAIQAKPDIPKGEYFCFNVEIVDLNGSLRSL